MIGPELYIANAVAGWTMTDYVSEPMPGVTRIDTPRTTRYVLRRAGIDVLELLDGTEPHRRAIVEDSFGSPTPKLPDSVTAKHMPVMLRPAGPAATTACEGVQVERVSTVDDLETAEQIIVKGFPVQGDVAVGDLLPAKALGQPGWIAWLATHNGEPAASCYTVDDGASVGVYLLATLPEHRSAGLGRAIMTAAVNQNPTLPTTLVATQAGAPLYRSMGFVDVSTAVWYIR